MSKFNVAAVELLEEAIALSGEPSEDLLDCYERALSHRLNRGEKNIVPMHQLVSGPADPKIATAAHKFLEAGRLFERSHYVDDLHMALKAYYWAYRFYEQLPGEQYREEAARALHFSGTGHLTLAEITRDDHERAEYYRRAAEFFMREAWVTEKSNNLTRARDAYGSASHYYSLLVDAMEESAYAARDKARLCEELGDVKSAATVLEQAAELLQTVERLQTSAKSDMLRRIQTKWLQEAGYNYLKLETQEDKENALNAFTLAIDTELSIQKSDSGIVSRLYREAIDLAQQLGRYKELDQLRYSFYEIRRNFASKQGQHLFVIFSHINNWIWGYGIKPLRLLRVTIITILVFAILYILFEEIQLKTNPIDPEKALAQYIVLCFIYSLYSILPTGVIQFFTGAGLIIDFEVTDITKSLSAIESVIGLIYLTMATTMAQQAVRRMWP
jgi:hypothetical protein